MSDSQTCAASARCIRCHASWETICRDTNMNHDKHVETCTGRASDTSQEKRACTYGCGRWLVGVQDAQKHTEHCEQKMRKGRGEENAPGMVSSLEAERERIRRALKGHWEDLPAEYELARAAVREELSGDNDFPLALPAERMVAIYRRFAESIKNARNTMKEAMTKKQKPHKDSQMALDHESFTGILASAQVGTPLTAGEYLERLAKDCNDHDGGFQPSDWVVCTQRQASILLLVHHPVRPILVLGGVGDPMPEEVCMRRLERQLDYEIHDLTRKNPGKTGADSTMDPSKMPIKTFLSVQESRDRPLNMLSLPPFREAIPPFLNLPDYDVIDSCIPEQDGSGKHPTDKVRDCAKFGLCALKGAMSVWHMDQHGFTTAAICECGCKLWMLLPGMPLDKCAEYAKQMRSNRDKYVAPDWPIVGVPMRAGDVLIQPEGTLHAPYSESWPVTMSGYMLWSQRGMVRSTEVMTLEVKENTSNEDPAEGLVDKLQCVAETWARALNEKKDGLWPNEDQLGIFRDEVEVSHTPSRASTCCHVHLKQDLDTDCNGRNSRRLSENMLRISPRAVAMHLSPGKSKK